ncbi:hypothetical protein Tco_0722655 [Tanacetum coccineum]
MPGLPIHGGNKTIVCPKTSSRSSSSSRRALSDLSKCKGGVPDDGAMVPIDGMSVDGCNGSGMGSNAPRSSRIIAARWPNERIGLAGGDGDNTGTGDDTGRGEGNMRYGGDTDSV